MPFSVSSLFSSLPHPAILQKYLDNFDLSIKIIYILGTLGFSIGMKPKRQQKTVIIYELKLIDFSLSFSTTIGTAFMALFPNVYVAMVMISSMGIISMSISYCPYALLGQYHEMKEVQKYSA